MNLVAVHFLTPSFEEEEHLAFIKDAKTDDWPSGLACKIWKNLENEFRPSDVLADAKLSKKLMGLTLAKGEDPRKLGKRPQSFSHGLKFKLRRRKRFRQL